MPNSIPKGIKKTIKQKTFAILDERQYLSQTRRENGLLMNELVANPDIGGVLSGFMPKAAIKTYIKDALINDYAKKQNAKSISGEAVEARLTVSEGTNVHLIEGSFDKKVMFLCAENGTLIVAGIGSLSKWETALRKALEFIEKAPNLPPTTGALKVYLLISMKGKSLTDSEKKHIINTLSLINISLELFQ